MDIAAANKTGSVSILLNDSAGGFGAATEFTVGFLPVSVCSADFNNDSIPDLATANLGPWTVTVIVGDGAGSFAADSEFAANTPNEVISSDFNGDGNADLAVTTSTRVLIALGNGVGGFSSPVSYGVGHSYQSITSADFNGDSITDLAMTGSNLVWVLWGNGNGSFGPPVSFAAGAGAQGIVSGHFNGDTIPDLATCNRFTNDISVLAGMNTGGFAAPMHFAAGSAPTSIATADFDGDAIADLATGNSNTGNISVLTGDGSGNFSVVFNCIVDSFPNSLITADFNNDGKMDLAAVTVYSNIDSGNVAVLLNCSITGINPVTEKSEQLVVYPNPCNGIFNIDLKGSGETKFSVDIFNVLSEKVYSKSNLSIQTSNEINTGEIPAGIYFVKLYVGESVFAQKIIVQ